MSACPYGLDDAAYVLGALPPDEHRAFEEHLAGCAACRASVRDLAGLPGLLARVDAPGSGTPGTTLATMDDLTAGPVPPTLLPRLLAAASRERRRTRRWLVAVAAAVVLLLSLAVPFALLQDGSGPDGPAAQASPSVSASPGVRLVMKPPAGRTSRISATVDLTPVRWGTRVKVHCVYPPEPTPEVRPYELVAVTKAGVVDRIGSWKIASGKEANFESPTRYWPGELDRVEVRIPSGRVILLATL
jgi:hypothetical protein